MARSEKSPTSALWAAAMRGEPMDWVLTVGVLLLGGVLVGALGLMWQEATYYAPCEGFFVGGFEVRDSRTPVLWHAPESPLMAGDSAR